MHFLSFVQRGNKLASFSAKLSTDCWLHTQILNLVGLAPSSIPLCSGQGLVDFEILTCAQQVRRAFV